MLPRERLEIIKQIAREERRVYVSKLSKKFRVTEETIRRDLDKLEAQGIVTRSYGGAILNTDINTTDTTCTNKLEEDTGKGQVIAEKTLEFIKEGSTIMADSSVEALETLKLIEERHDVTVVTNSILVLQGLNKSKLNIISTGGSLNSKAMSFQGNITLNTIKNYHVDIALIGCMGMNITKGILDINEAEAEIKRTMIKQADKVILLADHAKFDKLSLVKLFDYKDIDYIVTDKEPKDEWKNLLSSHNIKVIYL